MPSDELSRKALDVLVDRAERFRSAVTLTAAQLRERLAAQKAAAGGTDQTAAVLGKFASARVDPARFSALLKPQKSHDVAWTKAIERAIKVLDELSNLGDALFHVRVEAGGDLVAAVDQALANAGRAFGAARIAKLADSSLYRAEEHDAFLNSFPFRSWSRDERRMAPPIVVEVAGGDLAASGLASYLDGSQVIVLLAEGQSPVAPLARLISPGVLVVQTDSADGLAALADVAGPAVAAVLAGESARFAHTPSAAMRSARLEVTHLPAREPHRQLGSISVFQQAQDLGVLAALVAPAAAGPADAPASTNGHGASSDAALQTAQANGSNAAADPVGALAAWLLARVDLSDLENAS